MKKILLGLLILISTIAMAEEIKVGVIASLTGAVQIYGQAELNGVMLAADKINAQGGINGKVIKIVAEDDKSKTNDAVLAAEKLMNTEKVSVVIGPISEIDTFAVSKVANNAKIPLVTPTGSDARISKEGEYVSKIQPSDDYQGIIMANFAKENLKAKRAVVIKNEKNSYTVEIANLFKGQFEKNGGKVVREIEIANITESLKTENLNADVIFVPFYYTEAVGIVGEIKRQKKDAVILGLANWNNYTFFNVVGNEMDGGYIPSTFAADSKEPSIQNFFKEYKEKFGIDANVVSAQSYDCMMLVAEAIKKSGNPIPENIKSEINKMKDFSGITGTITMGADRSVLKSMAVLKADKGSFGYETMVHSSVLPNTLEEKKNGGNLIVYLAILALLIIVVSYISRKKSGKQPEKKNKKNK